MSKPRKTKSAKWQVKVYAGKDPEGKHQYINGTFDSKKEAQEAISRIKLDQMTRQRTDDNTWLI